MRKRLLVSMLGKAMRATPEELQSATFRQRVEPFLARSGSKRTLCCRIGHAEYSLRRPKRRSGGFRGKILLEKHEVDRLIDSGHWHDGRLQVTVETENLPATTATVFVLPNAGVSVVSDIDDTIKVTEIGDRRKLLSNTFLREFRSVDGMSQVYQEWAKRGAEFHYVSSSPWQLFSALESLLSESGFPAGTVHLRYFRFRDEFVRRRTKSRKRKSRTIQRLLRVYPNRKFILVGDSGERDPEIYARLAAKFPQQVATVLIRDLPEKPLSKERYQKLVDEFSDCRVFTHADELAKITGNLW